ncbi:DUF4328 domain-containing protein [Streptomyces sp. NPDC018693]|uniref:DUF4328 domain-containing protein n=1 Tax=unclassified Streptomyces TaxID=2593676 RepID=UPI003799ED4E
MLCTRCRRFDVAPGNELCRQCEAADAHPPAPLPVPAVAPFAQLRSPVGLGWAAVALLGAVVLTDLFAIGVDLFAYGVWDDIVQGEAGPGLYRRAELTDTLFVTAGVLQTVALVASAVVFVCWFYRVRVNAEVFNPFGHAKKRGWAIAGWIVPIVSLWYPRRVALDIWDASGDPERPSGHGLLNGWWTMWIISLTADRFVSRAYQRAEEAEELRRAVAQVMLADLADVVAAVLAIVLVLRLTRMQHAKAMRGPVAGGVLPTPAVG